MAEPSDPGPPVDGLVVVAKPAGMTSHDVVARVRRILRTRRVGHAGTLDPDATGVLVVGVGKATRLLAHLAGDDKEYRAVIRLGSTTSTDDAAGATVAVADPARTAEVTDDMIMTAVAGLTGELSQVPPAVSAVKVAGRRAYARARAGEDVVLAPRTVRVSSFTVLGVRRDAEPSGAYRIEVTATVVCSAGTYVRSLARDLGAALGVGGHLAALERTRSGVFTLAEAVTMPDLADSPTVVPMAEVVRRMLPVRTVDAEEARHLAYGRSLPPSGLPGTVAAIGPGGTVVALLRDVTAEGPAGEAGPRARPSVVFAPAG